ncbi:type IV pilus assembly protein FimV [Halomonas sp. GT]|uniref:type IV pilus assembly protein FimV n=1 Tax=Halomonas sp. GT TaxID=1971364 RepID=UPI0009F2EBBA|nr:FimV/HubP family polar landmark protein [Halomonas sp. GT]
MKKKLARLLWLSLSAVSPLALALGLGQATVNSPLDAPLEATVPLHDSGHFALSDLRVDVASESAFKALGLEWSPLTANISVQLQEQPNGHRLLLRSSQAIHEPWLDLLLTISSPEGRQTRALTLLFDPPEYAMDSSGDDVSAREATNRATAATAQAARDIAYVASGDTLWGVAARVKPADVTIQQMMMALLEANPSAFPSGNADELRAGQSLTVPSRQQITSLTPRNAAQAIQAMRQPASRRVAEPQEAPERQGDSSTDQANEPAMVSDNQGANQSQEMADTETADEEQVLAAELLESQARLQAVLDERDQMRDELVMLRQEMASLTQALSASQRELEQVNEMSDVMASSDAPNEAPNMSHSQSASETIIERVTAYQWPLASIVLALLLAALVWSRKRRERQWEDVPLVSPSGPAGAHPPDVVADSAAPRAPLETSQQNVSGRTDPQHVEPLHDETEHVEKEHVEKGHVEPDQLESELLAQEEPISELFVPLKEKQDEASQTDEDELALDNAFLDTPEPVEEPSKSDEGRQAGTIDYEPPSIEPQEPPAETPLQPTVDFTWDYVSSEQESEVAKTAAEQQRKAAEDEWEIEEVAFEPRRRDNSAP